MAKTIQTSIDQVKNWLVLNSSAVPFIAAYGLRQWSEGVYQRYPNNALLHFCGIRYTRAGAEVQFFCNQGDYYDSFHKIINDQKTLEKIYDDFCEDEKNFHDFIRTIEKRGMVFLHEHYKEFIDLYDQEYISGVPIDGILVYSEEFFPAMKKKYWRHELALEILIKPYGETFVGRYHTCLLKAALKLNKNFGDAGALLADEEALQEVKEIQKLFFWIKNSYKNTEPLSLDFFAQELLEMTQRGSETNRNEEKILSEELIKHRAECERIAAERIFSDEDYEKMLWFGKIAWWVIGAGQFCTVEQLETLIGEGQQLIRSSTQPAYVGIDTAKSPDQTIVTVLVDDEKDPRKSKLAGWLSLKGENYEDQFEAIADWLNPKYEEYEEKGKKKERLIAGFPEIRGIALDATGQGDFMPDKFERHTGYNIIRVPFTLQSKDTIYKNLLQVIQNGLTSIPDVRSDRDWIGWLTECVNLVKEWKGRYLSVHHPDDPNAHDDYPDSWALAEYAKTQLVSSEPTIRVL
jgi:hypothetical protein